ncbi:50S ribosomal protein L10 [Haloferula sp. A504]|jgi:large subunit ribosomal protein L10|uniref:50S ribosomal protein L10 n=1 Tax=Haloferula sp. A504 TaxID=3373601 RepID=UPI0031CA8C62|nr:50S ribosomal protein L10 [Verrucomicrobiaceae bacterium E54]
MNPDKKIIIDELLERVNSSPFVLVVEYTGMTVPEFSELRTRLAATGAECHVAKNTYMKKALTEAGLPDPGESLVGQTAFVTGEADVAAAAKVLKSFEKEFKKPAIKLGILDGDILDEEQVKAIAELPAREVLLATLLSTINAPASQLVRTLNEPASSLARVIQAKFKSED